MLHVGELVVAFCHAGGTAEVVERDRGVAPLTEAERKLLVEPIQPTDIRQDDHADRAGSSGTAEKAANLVPSAATSTMSWEVTGAPPERTGIGGRESISKHMTRP